MSSRRCQDKAPGATSDNRSGGLSRNNRSVTSHFIIFFSPFPIFPSPNRERIANYPFRPACTFRITYLVVSRAHGTGTVRNIILHDGLRGMYRGLGPTILGYLPTWAIYFAVYDGIKTRFGELPLGIDEPVAKSERLYPAPSAKGYQPIVREHPWSIHILSAMTAGATSTICTNPLWVIKTRFMVRWCSLSSSPSPSRPVTHTHTNMISSSAAIREGAYSISFSRH